MKDETKTKQMLEAEVGNLEVQISEYRQIIKELSDKLELYQEKYGVVFQPNRR